MRSPSGHKDRLATLRYGNVIPRGHLDHQAKRVFALFAYVTDTGQLHFTRAISYQKGIIKLNGALLCRCDLDKANYTSQGQCHTKRASQSRSYECLSLSNCGHERTVLLNIQSFEYINVINDSKDEYLNQHIPVYFKINEVQQ